MLMRKTDFQVKEDGNSELEFECIQYIHNRKGEKMAQRYKHDIISLQKRKKLIELVEEKNFLISEAGKKLGIKLSTAKLIVKRYRETGTFATRRVPATHESSSQEQERQPNMAQATQNNIPNSNNSEKSPENLQLGFMSYQWLWMNGYRPYMVFMPLRND